MLADECEPVTIGGDYLAVVGKTYGEWLFYDEPHTIDEVD